MENIKREQWNEEHRKHRSWCVVGFAVSALAMSPTSRQRADQQKTAVLDVRVYATLDCSLRDLASAATKDTVFALTEKGELIAWSGSKGAERWRRSEPAAIAIECQGSALVAAMRVPCVASYHWRTGERLTLIDSGYRQVVRDLVVDEENKYSWIAATDRIIGFNEQGMIGEYAIEDAEITSIAVSQDNELLGIGANNGAVFVYKRKRQTRLAPRIVLSPSISIRVSDRPIAALAFASKVMVASSDDGKLRAVRLNDYQTAFELQCQNVINVFAVPSEGGWMACGDRGGRVELRDLSSGRLIAEWESPLGGRVVGLTYADKSQTLFAGVGSTVVELRRK